MKKKDNKVRNKSIEAMTGKSRLVKSNREVGA
jgi:hypothetical protein